jgi:hypothetical protein
VEEEEEKRRMEARTNWHRKRELQTYLSSMLHKVVLILFRGGSFCQKIESANPAQLS